jgi:uncharacterized membrane protein
LKRNNASLIFRAGLPLVYLALAIVLVAVVSVNGVYPSGTDTLYHLYRGNAILQAIQQGDWYPFYDPMWFNGTQLLGFTPPISGYVLALCQLLAGGEVYSGYLLFLGLLFDLGAWAWLYVGIRRERPVLGAVLGVVWFFLPYHLHVLFVDGDLARALALPILPLLIDRIDSYLQTKRRTDLLVIALCLLGLTLTHAGFAAMTAIGLALLLLLRGVMLRTVRGYGSLILAVLSGALMGGLWLVPYLRSGILDHDYSETMAASFQTIIKSLNVLQNIETSGSGVYFGLALFLVVLCTGFLGKRRSMPGAWTAIFLLICTTFAAYLVLRLLPGSSYLHMFWLFPVAAAVGLLAFLSWNTARRWLTILLCLLLLADSVPSLTLLTGGEQLSTMAEERADSTLSATLLDEAQEITSHRLALLDEGNLGSEGVFLASAWENPTPIIDGDDRVHAVTENRLQRISAALTGGEYLYVFDRCLELGCDTILIQNTLLPQEDQDSGVVEEAAARLDYELVDTNGIYSLYHRELGSDWGLVSQYSAIGIGSTAYYMALSYPAMEETADTNLNHYTFQQLSQYDQVLLSGFTYDDKEEAEELVLALSEAGVRVVIEADGVPKNQTSSEHSFLGVVCNPVEFTGGYPELDTLDGILNTDLFPQGHTDWDTFYVEGLDQVWGYAVDNDVAFPFYGTVENENIVFIGLNLSYHYALTGDEAVGALLSHAMNLSADCLPQRTVVPLEVSCTSWGMEITSEQDGVNTTFAWQEFFSADAPVENRNGLLQVNAGTTSISFQYPAFWLGLGVSVLGLGLLCAVLFYRKRKT